MRGGGKGPSSIGASESARRKAAGSLEFGVWDLGFGISLLVCAFASGALADETHWSLKPVARPTVPAVADPKWKPRNPIDNFVLGKLREARLSPSPEAPRRTLIRRLYFDLIGPPPTPAEAMAFERARSPN